MKRKRREKVILHFVFAPLPSCIVFFFVCFFFLRGLNYDIFEQAGVRTFLSCAKRGSEGTEGEEIISETQLHIPERSDFRSTTP